MFCFFGVCFLPLHPDQREWGHHFFSCFFFPLEEEKGFTRMLSPRRTCMGEEPEADPEETNVCFPLIPRATPRLTGAGMRAKQG
jgi:hypothetical protein